MLCALVCVFVCACVRVYCLQVKRFVHNALLEDIRTGGPQDLKHVEPQVCVSGIREGKEAGRADRLYCARMPHERM